MRTKFDVSPDFLNRAFKNKEQSLLYFEKYYKNDGFELDLDKVEVVKIVDKEIHLNVGDRIVFNNEYRIVIWKRVNIDDDIIEYVVEEEEEYERQN